MDENYSPIDIHATPGTKVIYMAQGGFDSDREQADEVLTKGETYTVSRTIVGGWMTDVILEEHPSYLLNSVMFKEA